MSHNIRQHLTRKNAGLAALGAGWLVAAAILIGHVGSKPAMTIGREGTGSLSVKTAPALSTTQSKPQLDYVNQIRADHGVAPLREDPRLDASAADKAADLISENYFAHTSPQRGAFYTFIYKQVSVRKAGENLDECQADNEAAFAAFVASPEHLDNILDPAFNIFGSALVYQPNDHCLLWVDHFGEL
jgi:uncharacterized protein YkwD